MYEKVVGYAKVKINANATNKKEAKTTFDTENFPGSVDKKMAFWVR